MSMRQASRIEPDNKNTEPQTGLPVIKLGTDLEIATNQHLESLLPADLEREPGAVDPGTSSMVCQLREQAAGAASEIEQVPGRGVASEKRPQDLTSPLKPPVMLLDLFD